MPNARTLLATTTAIAALALTACGATHTEGHAGPERTATVTTTPTAKPSTPSAHPLGYAATTDGDPDTGGVLQITPTSVIYATKTSTDKPDNGRFVIITTKVQAMTAAPAAETAPADGGGWTYIAPDGQAITTMDGNATTVTLDDFNGAGTFDPGTFKWDSEAFDIAPNQAGGTLSYKDGSGHITRWTLPKTNTGPQVDKVIKDLQ